MPTATDNLSKEIMDLIKKYEEQITAADFALTLLRWSTWVTMKYAPSRQEGYHFINECVQESIKKFDELEEEYGPEED